MPLGLGSPENRACKQCFMQLGSLFGSKGPGSRSSIMGGNKTRMHQNGQGRGPHSLQVELLRSLMKRMSKPSAPWIKKEAFTYWPSSPTRQRQPHRCRLSFPGCTCMSPKEVLPLDRKQEVIYCRPTVRHCQAALQRRWSKPV